MTMSATSSISKIVTLSVLAASLAFGSVWAQSQRLDRIVALVEEDVILQSELDAAVAMIQIQFDSQQQSLPPQNVLEEQMLERLIRTRLEVQRAEQTGIRVSDTDLDRALEQIAGQNQMTLRQLRQAMEADGFDFLEFRRQIREEIMSQELRSRVARGMDDITETEIDILLASDRFSGAEYDLSQIMIEVPESATPQQVQEAIVTTQTVLDELAGGMAFSAAAMAYSQAPDALEGGAVGWRNLNALPPMFAEALSALQPGEVSEPIRTPAGFLIVRVNDIREQAEVIVEEYQVRHLMIEPTELLDIREVERRVADLHQRVAAGEPFEELARRHSTDETSANIGGLLNWFPADAYGRDFQIELSQLEVGELSQPFQTDMGWHFIRLEAVREADRTVEAMREAAREMLMNQKAEETVDRFLRRLRDEAYVEVRL
jgi:peptidyl-prolyl cis-trans isomerase SurA